MKQFSSILACALAFAAASASAQDSAKIAQGGVGNSAMIEQVATAGNNSASVNQGDNWYGNGSGNSAQLMQYAVGNSQIEVYQSGYNNQHTVYQSDGYNLQARVNVNSSYYGGGFGEGNSVMIQQSGSDAMASVEQGSSAYSRAEIWQQGWGGQSMADVVQSGYGNMASVQQMGGGQASIYQSGSNQNASIMQRSDNYGYGYGYGNSATIRQGF